MRKFMVLVSLVLLAGLGWQVWKLSRHTPNASSHEKKAFGFRDLEFGAKLADIQGTVPVRLDGERNTFTRDSDLLMIGHHLLLGIVYHFNDADELYKVRIVLNENDRLGHGDDTDVVRELSKRYGKAEKQENGSWEWSPEGGFVIASGSFIMIDSFTVSRPSIHSGV